MTLEALSTSILNNLVIPTYSLATIDSNGLIKQIRVDSEAAGQSLVYARMPDAETVGWYSVNNSKLQANTTYGGTIQKLSGNSRTYLDGNGNWNPGPLRYERMIFSPEGRLIFDVDIPANLSRMVRYVYITASTNIAVGLLSISFLASSTPADIDFYFLAGSQSVFDTISITSIIRTHNNVDNHRLTITNTSTDSNRYITLLGVDDALPTPTSTSNASYIINN